MAGYNVGFVGYGSIRGGNGIVSKSSSVCEIDQRLVLRGRGFQGTRGSVRCEAAGPESPAAGAQLDTKSEPLPLTWENVDLVLDEMRPYLMSDGGNVRIGDIDGATVRLQLEGACGTCPSSTMTMKMGLERRLMERIPEIESVVQVEPEGPALEEENVEKVLSEVRPFLNVAGGSIELVGISGIDSSQPTLRLHMTGAGAAINSVKVEITQRLKRNFPKLAQVTFE
mmetsp:Transcript_12118/g.21906  ORF Transcript_12118/g.21906 Transcript_12118/m.21906 type:complete len:226 (-) Transcript_12118:925-1602(-)|eukprot:CAMPEP_0182441154 /NCGR_PEP_ID=MMETSP1172-20130603/109_1 /TAXON_ID=708627 /ORGANISM="Timspurckia oligopyrenoides, Strain CCMP3278" /LENGTH=225 /DNA_ID=CAMNT_0024635315 /DNA_START=38 /DNA_END=715 /DNA_ORIENTATION=+